MPGQENKAVEITNIYGKREAQQVIVKSMNDYKKHFR
jgi:inorganic pyrophosphatase